MTSVSLRAVLTRNFDVSVGLYSYGSLLRPGAADRRTHIGRYVSIGPGVLRFGANHPMESPSLHPYWFREEFGHAESGTDVERFPIAIEHESWIGARVVILPSCRRIGIGAVVGAGSIVTEDVPDFAVVVGNPARVKKHRFAESVQSELLSARPWELPPSHAHREWARFRLI